MKGDFFLSNYILEEKIKDNNVDRKNCHSCFIPSEDDQIL